MRHTDTLHHIITAYKERFDHMDGVMRPWPEDNTQLKEDLFIAVKLT